MSLVNKLGIKAKIAKDNMVNKAMNKLKGMEKGLDGIIVVIILMVIAVAVCIFFKAEILDLVKNMTSKAETNIDGMFTNALT